MVFYISLFLLLLLFCLSITANRNAIAVYVFIFLFLPNEIGITKMFDLTAHKAAYLIFTIYIFQINGFRKNNPLKWGYFILILSLIVPFFNSINSNGNLYYNFLIYFIPNLIFPSLFLFYAIKTEIDLKVIFKGLIILIYIWSIYGAFEFISSSNPFIDSLIKEFPTKTLSVSKGYNYTENTRFGTFSRLQCTVWHPISFGIRINIILAILSYLKFNYTKIFFITKFRVYYYYYTPIIMLTFLSFATYSRSIWIDTILILLLYRIILLNKYQIKNFLITFFSKFNNLILRLIFDLTFHCYFK
jgi:hypothetical protein